LPFGLCGASSPKRRRGKGSLKANAATLFPIKKARMGLGPKAGISTNTPIKQMRMASVLKGGTTIVHTTKVGKKLGSAAVTHLQDHLTSGFASTCPSHQQKLIIIMPHQSDQYTPSCSPCPIVPPLLTFYLLFHCRGTTRISLALGLREPPSETAGLLWETVTNPEGLEKADSTLSPLLDTKSLPSSCWTTWRSVPSGRGSRVRPNEPMPR
jgi:hypothetical protein